MRWPGCPPAVLSELPSTLPASCGGSPSAVSAQQRETQSASRHHAVKKKTEKKRQRYLVGELVVLVPLPVVREVLHLRQELSFGGRRAVIGRTAGARTRPPEGGRVYLIIYAKAVKQTS